MINIRISIANTYAYISLIKFFIFEQVLKSPIHIYEQSYIWIIFINGLYIFLKFLGKEVNIMKIVKPSYNIRLTSDPKDMMKNIESAGRICYKSENKITDDSYVDFIKGLIERGHESVLEHSSITVSIVCDRGVSHELVRHRLASFSQESTRYCNYSNDKFGNEITVIDPCYWEDKECPGYLHWRAACESAEHFYFKILHSGGTAQEARAVLPNSLKTEIFITANFREWRHILKLRRDLAAHPQMREIMIPLGDELKELFPPIFSDID